MRDESSWRIERLAAASKKCGGDAELGRLIGHQSGAQIGHMLKGRRPVTEKTVKKIETLRGFEGWFDQQPSDHKALTTPAQNNIELGPDAYGSYPLISEVQAGNWTELQDNFAPGDAEEWLPSTKNLGPNGYMLRVKGDSMTNPGSRLSFPDGTILHVKPGCTPTPGQFVIVRREHTQEATFKKYVVIENEPYLEAINPDWPKEKKYLPLRPGDEWCGVVVDASLGGLP